jgi:hypothetical protein
MVAAAPSKTLNIYFVDVEGGQSTLFMSHQPHTSVMWN